jgi:hypothetical protein
MRAKRIHTVENPNGAHDAELQKPQRHDDREQAPAFRLASELSPRAIAENRAGDRARKGS